MNIYFIETEHGERGFFEEALKGHTLRFVACLDEVNADAEVLSIFIHSRIERRFLDQHPNMTLITTHSTGYDHIDLAGCARRRITVYFVSSYGDNMVAEHTFALILALGRRTREAREACKQGTNAFLAGKPVNVLQQFVESRTTSVSSTTGEDQAADGMVLSQK
jgi:D-lactate dehydrogenase